MPGFSDTQANDYEHFAPEALRLSTFDLQPLTNYNQIKCLSSSSKGPWQPYGSFLRWEGWLFRGYGGTQLV